MLQIQKLSLQLGDSPILSNIDLSIKKGEWMTILGKNGSGKSSLLKSILKLYSYEGDIKIEGNCVRDYSSEALAKLISYVPQTPPSDLQMEVNDFLLLARYPYRNDLELKHDDQKLIDQMMTELAITELRSRNFSTLSGGEQQKVLIASALVQQTPIILLDEPGSFLDPAFRNTILNKLRIISKKKRVAVIEVSHDLNTTAQVADRFIALKDGLKVFDSTIVDLFVPDTLSKIYDQKFQILYDKELNLKAALPLGVSQ